MRLFFPVIGLVIATTTTMATMMTTTALASEISSPASARSRLLLTVYADGLALVEETRGVSLPTGSSSVAIEDISPRLQPASVVVTASDTEISGVRYDLLVLSAETLLNRHLGKEVTLIRTNPKTGEETAVKATLLAINGRPVLRVGDLIETNSPGRIAFSDIPEGLRTRPALLVDLNAGAGGRRDMDIRYTLPGVDWTADYVIVLDRSNERASVTGRAIVTNRSGTAFPDATLSLVAGQINREPTPATPNPRVVRAEAMAAAAPAAAPKRQEVGDVHLYTLPKPVSLGDQEVRLVPLMETADIPVTVEYVSTASVNPFRTDQERSRSNPDVRISFVNATGGTPGVPLPAGLARVFTADDQGVSRLLGEDRLQATPVGERVSIEPGKAFDISVDRRQTAFSRIDAQGNVFEAAYEIAVRNARSRPAVVRIVEDIPGDWQVLQESSKHEQINAGRIAWPLTVPAGGNAALTYRVRSRQ